MTLSLFPDAIIFSNEISRDERTDLTLDRTIHRSQILRGEPNGAPRSEIIEIVIGFSRHNIIETAFNPAFCMPGTFLVVKSIGDELQEQALLLMMHDSGTVVPQIGFRDE